MQLTSQKSSFKMNHKHLWSEQQRAWISSRIYITHAHWTWQMTFVPFNCENAWLCEFLSTQACTRMTSCLLVVNPALQCSVSFMQVHARPCILKTPIRSLWGTLTVPAPLEPNGSPEGPRAKKKNRKERKKFGEQKVCASIWHVDTSHFTVCVKGWLISMADLLERARRLERIAMSN